MHFTSRTYCHQSRRFTKGSKFAVTVKPISFLKTYMASSQERYLFLMIRSTTYDYANFSAGEIIITCSISLCPVDSLWSSVSLWKKNVILHSWQVHIAFRSSGCMYVISFLAPRCNSVINLGIDQLCSYFLFKQITSNSSMLSTPLLCTYE